MHLAIPLEQMTAADKLQAIEGILPASTRSIPICRSSATRSANLT